MKLLRVRLFSCVVAAVLIPLLLAPAVAQAQAAPWTVVPSPNPGVAGNELLAAASVSANDVWAVGEATNTTGQVTLTEHWNGTAWSVIPSPNVGSGFNTLQAAAAVSTNEVWAVGQSSTASGAVQTLIEQWNGTAWSVVSSPNPSASLNILDGAAADPSSGQAWAVGVFENASSTIQTLTEFNP